MRHYKYAFYKHKTACYTSEQVNSIFLKLSILTAAVCISCACAKRLVKKPPSGLQAASAVLAEPDIRGSLFASTPDLRAIRFEFDRHALGEAAREILKQNSLAIKKNGGWDVLIEGHCDERGSTEYNLALAQSRAKAVRDYYVLLGIAGSRIATIAYGEERPVCSQATEDCWSKNRRAENKIKAGLARGGSHFKP